MTRKIEIDYYEWHRLRNAIEAMQGHTFYCQDDEGVLRRWHPPAMPSESKKAD